MRLSKSFTTKDLKSAFLCVRAVAKSMMERRKGRIINLGSQSGTGPRSIPRPQLSESGSGDRFE